MIRVLVTGANGFIGQKLCTMMAAETSFQVRAATRQPYAGLPDNIVVGDLDAKTRWDEALKDVDVVIHLAARVHVMQETNANPLAAFRQVNVEGTRQLAKACLKHGVRRFVYLSSIKVNGEQTKDQPFRADDLPGPVDPYGVSKLEAEQLLLQLANDSPLEVSIIRPPLVYGPGVKGNFERLIHLVKRRVPLPLGGINNQRSLVSVFNLIDLVICCVAHPEAKNRVFLVSDGEDLSTPELIREIARAVGVEARLVSIPVVLLAVLGRFLRKKAEVQRLTGSLQLDISSTCDFLDWSPPVLRREGLDRTVNE